MPSTPLPTTSSPTPSLQDETIEELQMTLSGIGELTEADEQIFIEVAEGFVEEFYTDSSRGPQGGLSGGALYTRDSRTVGAGIRPSVSVSRWALLANCLLNTATRMRTCTFRS